MRKLLLVTGAAALAIAMPVAAEKGGKGGAKEQGGKPAHVHQGGGKLAKGPKAAHAVHAGKPAKFDRAVKTMKPAKLDRRGIKKEAKRQERFLDRSDGRAADRGVFRGDRIAGFAGDCPPGLARKRPACIPPGQAKKLGLGDRIQSSWFGADRIPSWYSGFYPETADYYYRYDDDGYIYRIDRDGDLIDSIIPLLGGGFAVGQPLPAGYDVYNVPVQYRDAYYDSDEHLYRYGDNAIYRVDAENGLIESVVALLGGDMVVGQPLPDGYDAYNLPYDYRDRYEDGDDATYRYADGGIYEVDPKTMLVERLIEMLI